MRNCLMMAAVAAAVVAPSMARAETLDLVCRGTTRAYERSTGSATVFNNRGDSATGYGSSMRMGQTSDQFRVRIDGAAGKVKPPAALIPPLTGGGLGDGWWGLKNVTVTDAQITGTYSHSLVYSPRVTIDRRTGEIDVRGAGGTGFNGACEVAPETPETRRF